MSYTPIHEEPLSNPTRLILRANIFLIITKPLVNFNYVMHADGYKNRQNHIRGDEFGCNKTINHTADSVTQMAEGHGPTHGRCHPSHEMDLHA